MGCGCKKKTVEVVNPKLTIKVTETTTKDINLDQIQQNQIDQIVEKLNQINGSN